MITTSQTRALEHEVYARGDGEVALRSASRMTAADVKAQIEAQVKSALDQALTTQRQELAEPLLWWDLFAIGPIQPIGIPAPLLPHQVIKVGEPAFVATILVLNPALVLFPGTTAADVLSNFALPYEVQYCTGNICTWTLGQADMNVVHSGPGFNLIPGVFAYVDVLGFTATTPGLYELNIAARILGATPPFVNAPQFAGYATAVIDIDAAIAGFVGTVPGVPGPGPVVNLGQPCRFQIYPA